jgi:phosphoglycolate phosphatase
VLNLLIFDMDGTLVDSYGPIAVCLNKVRAHFGHPPLVAEAVRGMVGHGLETLIEQNVGPANIAKGVEIFRESYARLGPTETFLLPGVAETLRKLHRRGYRMAVATNKPARFASQILEALGLAPLFSQVLGPELVCHPKPHPEMVERLLEENGARREEAVVVGDMSVDIAMARAAGVAVWAVATGSESCEELRRAEPDRLMTSFRELLLLLPPLSEGISQEETGEKYV